MRKQVWRFLVQPYEAVALPRGARVVHVGLKAGQAQVWAEIDPEEPDLVVQLRVFGTGQDIPEGFEHVGSWVDESQMLVWHLYQEFVPKKVTP